MQTSYRFLSRLYYSRKPSFTAQNQNFCTRTCGFFHCNNSSKSFFSLGLISSSNGQNHQKRNFSRFPHRGFFMKTKQVKRIEINDQHSCICLLRNLSMAAIPTTDACDSNAALLASGDLRVLQPFFHIYGQRRTFSGPVVTVKVFEDNVLVRELIESNGEGRVLVVDGGGSTRCALVGGNLGHIAQNMGWAGIVVNGCIRDVDEINGCDIGVRALGSNPIKSNKKGIGEKHSPVHFGGTLIREGEWLYADSDGILISKSELYI